MTKKQTAIKNRKKDYVRKDGLRDDQITLRFSYRQLEWLDHTVSKVEAKGVFISRAAFVRAVVSFIMNQRIDFSDCISERDVEKKIVDHFAEFKKQQPIKRSWFRFRKDK